MKVGDLVRYRSRELPDPKQQPKSRPPGLVVYMTQKKVWRTHTQGRRVDWDRIDPEPHAGVLYAHNDDTIDIPVIDLEVINESR